MESKRVNKIRTTSILLSILFFVLMSPSITHAQSYSLVNQWNINDYKNNNNYIDNIAVDSSGNIYIVEVNDANLIGYIQILDNNGSLITKCNYQRPTPWSGIDYMTDVTVDSKGNIFISNDFHIDKLDSNGNLIAQWGEPGGNYHSEENPKCNGLFFNVDGIAVDSSDNIYVADTWNYRIQKFNNNGQFIAQWGAYADDPSYGIARAPRDIAVDSKGNIYVVSGTSVYKFDRTYYLINQIDMPSYITIYSILSIDSSDNVCVATPGSNKILIFDSNCTYLTELKLENTYSDLEDIDIDSSDNVYVTVSEPINNTWVRLLKKFAPIPEANFTVTPNKIRISDKVEFNASQYINPTGGSITWDFGDGKTDSSNNPIVYHNYSEPGSYTAKLTVKDSTGKEVTKSQNVNVTIPVVLVHGFISSSETWVDMSSALQENGFEVWNFGLCRNATFAFILT